MRVYAVCRKCAEVHLADAGCRRCARRTLLESPRAGDDLVASGEDSAAPTAPRPEPRSLAATTAPPRMWRMSTAVVAAYVLAVLGLLAAALLEI